MLDVSGFKRITAAYDLSANAITALAHAMDEKASMLEVIVHAHLPIFHTEHCVFARFLSKGNSYLDCGHACQRHTVHLRDQSGADNLVLADMGCRNTVFSAEAQSGLYSITEWVDAGVGTLRVELVDENAEDAAKIVKGYLGVLSGRDRPSDVWDMLKEVRDSNGRCMSVGVGSLRNAIERRAGAL
jgi:collagenase-like PrtC family protease